MPSSGRVNNFVEKLNKTDTGYVIEDEELVLTDGVFEGELQHDNVKHESVMVFTGPKMSGERIENYFLSIPADAPWKRKIKVFCDLPVVYATYETLGDQVEAEDINRVQDSIVDTQTRIKEYKEASDQSIQNIDTRLTTVELTKAEIEHEHTRSHIIDFPTKVSEFENDTGYIREEDIPTPTTFTFSQITPAMEWEIEHGLGKFPSVTIVDSGGNVVVGDIQYSDKNKLKATFISAFSGKAYLN